MDEWMTIFMLRLWQQRAIIRLDYHVFMPFCPMDLKQRWTIQSFPIIMEVLPTMFNLKRLWYLCNMFFDWDSSFKSGSQIINNRIIHIYALQHMQLTICPLFDFCYFCTYFWCMYALMDLRNVFFFFLSGQ